MVLLDEESPKIHALVIRIGNVSSLELAPIFGYLGSQVLVCSTLRRLTIDTLNLHNDRPTSLTLLRASALLG